MGLPEELPLIQGILRGAPVLDVGVLRVRHGEGSERDSPVSSCRSSRRKRVDIRMGRGSVQFRKGVE